MGGERATGDLEACRCLGCCFCVVFWALLAAGVRLFVFAAAGEGFWDSVLSGDPARRSRSSRRRLSFLPAGRIHMLMALLISFHNRLKSRWQMC